MHEGHDLVAFGDEEAGAQLDYRCDACGYGAATNAPPRACPMCGAASWTHAARGVGSVGIRRLANSIFLVTPPPALDAAAGVLLLATLAELAYEHPEVVVDLTGVELDSSAAQLLLRLGALARGSGGRLLAVCPGGGPDGIEIHELDGQEGGVSAWSDGALGGALRLIAGRDDCEAVRSS